MKNRALASMLACVVFLGLVAFPPGPLVAASERCVGGKCFVAVPAGLNVQWPPRLGEPYPDLELIDQTGQLVRLSSFKGAVMLIEPVGMTCPACQAFSGAHRYGALDGIVPQRDLPSIDELFPRFTGGLSSSDGRIVFVQILLYSMSMRAPTPADARRWAEHFRMDRSKNRVVLAGTKDLLGPASFNMIPGFHLVDRNFIFRADATKNQNHDLFRYLLPMVPKLMTGLSVEEAYRAIPHRRTVFDIEAAKMSQGERAYLRRLFELVDLGVVERVGTLNALKSTGRRDPAENYERLLSQLKALSAPARLGSVHRLVAEAIQEQQAALEGWQKTGVPADFPRHPLVISSSGKLRRAYAELLALFPQEGQHNRDAFFDHLCALDFI